MQDTQNVSRTKLWVRIVLFASLAVNLAVIGIVAGAMYARPHGPDHRSGGREPVTPYARAFDEDQRRALRNALRDGFRGTHEAEKQALLEGYQKALVMIRADNFDVEAMGELLAAQTTRSEQRRERGNAILTETLSAMSVKERQKYADRLEEQIARFAERRWRKERP